MKYIVSLLLLFVFCQPLVWGQNSMQRISIFEEGCEVKSFEDNFKNLKANWKRIVNHADFEILSCDYAYTFENRKQITRYAKEHSRLESPFFAINIQAFVKDGKWEEKISVRLTSFAQMVDETTENKEGVRDSHLYHLELRKTEIVNRVTVGDRVYVIRYKMNGEEQMAYVVCSAESCKVICDYLFGGITFRKK